MATTSNDLTLPAIVTKQVGEQVLTFSTYGEEPTILLRKDGKDAEATREMVITQSREREKAFKNW